MAREGRHPISGARELCIGTARGGGLRQGDDHVGMTRSLLARKTQFTGCFYTAIWLIREDGCELRVGTRWAREDLTSNSR